MGKSSFINLIATSFVIIGLVEEMRAVNAVQLDFSKGTETVTRNIFTDNLMNNRLNKWTVKWTENWLNCWP